MSTVVRAAAPPAARPAPAGKAPARRAGSAPLPARGVRRLVAGTPGKLRIAAAVSVLAGLVFGLLGFASFQSRTAALREGTGHAEQVVRLRTIGTDLANANSIATAGFLAGGVSADRAAAYQQAMASVEQGMVDAVRAEPSDTAVLQQVAVTVGVYREEIEAALGDVAHGNGGTGHLREAQAALAGVPQELKGPVGVVPVQDALERIAGADAQRAEDAFAAAGSTWRLLAAMGLAVVALVVVQIFLARTTRRVLNLPLVVATLLVLVAGVVAVVVGLRAGQRVDAVRSTSYRSAIQLATARTDLFTARTAETLGFVSLRDGGSFDDQSFKNGVAGATSALSAAGRATSGSVGALQDSLSTWAGAHATLVGKAQQSDDQAVVAATEATTSGSALVKAFETFAVGSQARQAAVQQEASSGLREPVGSQQVTGWVVLAAGLAAAVLGWTGVGRRLREYR